MPKQGCNTIFHHSSKVLGRPAFILVQNPIGGIHIMWIKYPTTLTRVRVNTASCYHSVHPQATQCEIRTYESKLHLYCLGANLDFLLRIFFLTNSPQQAAGSDSKQQQDGRLQVHFNGSHWNSAVNIFLPADFYVKIAFFCRDTKVTLTNK